MGRDHLGHRLRLDGVPQLDHRQPGPPVPGQPPQLGNQVLPQGAAGAVVDQRGVARAQLPGAVAHGSPHGAGDGRGQVVVEGDAPLDRAQQLLDGRAPGVGVQSGDDRDGQRAGHRSARRP